ncbi:MAG TPA: serine/threonine-protein kinase [Kofleriaceae bacterium]|nr:serine/threonine-protein kinase [Kofleriaceae bacterium]
MDVEIGEVVEGRYKIVRPIAAGGMGTVFLAEHWLIKRRFALKILRGEYAADATMIRRFMNEALAAGTLGHPNIVEATDMGFTKTDTPYIVFEFLEGTSLASDIDRNGALSIPRALRIAYQIASALEAAHQADIIHRDLKSENVLLVRKLDIEDHVKVIDFGISRILTASDRTAVGNTVTGTPEYMAPEQILTPDSIDRRCDVYALGVVLYEMLAGKVPFAAAPGSSYPLDIDTAHALLTRILTERPAPFNRPDAPPGLVEMIVDKLLAKEAAERYQSMKQVQRAIEAFASVLPQRDTPAPTLDRLEPLAPEQLAAEVRQLGSRWSLEDGALTLDIYHRELSRLAAAAERSAAMADVLAARPRIAIEHPHLRLTIPEPTRVTSLVLAKRVEQWLREHW